MYNRGSVWWANIPDVGTKPIVIISSDVLNWALTEITAARITSIERERSLPTYVTLNQAEVAGLPERSFIICHNVFTLPKATLKEHLGDVPVERILDIENALRITFDL